MNLIFSYRQQLCVIYLFLYWWSDWQTRGKELMGNVSCYTSGVRGEVGTPTTLWSPPGMISHTDRQAWCHGTSHKHSHIDSRLTQDDSARKKKWGKAEVLRLSVTVWACWGVNNVFLTEAPKPSASEHVHTQTSVTLPDTGHCTLALEMAAVVLIG